MERRSGRLAGLQKQKPNIYRETGVRRVFKRPYKSKLSSSAIRLKRDCSPEQDSCPHSDSDSEDSTEKHTCSTELHEGSSCSSKCLPETSALVDTASNPPVFHNPGQIPLDTTGQPLATVKSILPAPATRPMPKESPGSSLMPGMALLHQSKRHGVLHNHSDQSSINEEQSRLVMKMVAFLATIFLLGIFSGFRLPSETCKHQMQLKLRHQNEILQQHLQQKIDHFQGQVAELQIQVETLAKIHRQQHRGTKKHPLGSDDSWVQGDNDHIQRKDFALKSLGASVVKYSESYKTSAHICMFGLCWKYSRSPDVILQRDNTPGHCWALRGSCGYVVVKLSNVIRPLAVTLDHISKKDSQTEEISSAPKNFAIYGLKEGFEEKGGAFLGEFIYDQDGLPVQTFKLEDANADQFGYLLLRVLSNWGHQNYTCIYGLRVHGDPAQESVQ